LRGTEKGRKFPQQQDLLIIQKAGPSNYYSLAEILTSERQRERERGSNREEATIGIESLRAGFLCLLSSGLPTHSFVSTPSAATDATPRISESLISTVRLRSDGPDLIKQLLL
jgi:hypothetical protein